MFLYLYLESRIYSIQTHLWRTQAASLLASKRKGSEFLVSAREARQ